MNAVSDWRRQVKNPQTSAAKKAPSRYASEVQRIFDRLYAIEPTVKKNLDI